MPSAVVLRVPLRFTMNDVNEMLGGVNGLALLRPTEWKEMVRGFIFQDIVDDILDDINTGQWNGDLASYRAEIERAITDYRFERRTILEAMRIQRRDIRRILKAQQKAQQEEEYLDYQIEVLSNSDGDSMDD